MPGEHNIFGQARDADVMPQRLRLQARGGDAPCVRRRRFPPLLAFSPALTPQWRPTAAAQ